MRDLSCVCCICTASESLSSLDSDDENNLKFLKKLTLCLPKETWKPHYQICRVCITQLDITYHFIQCCIDSEQLRQSNSVEKLDRTDDDEKFIKSNGSVVTQEENFTCNNCGTSFQQKKYLSQHIFELHSKNKYDGESNNVEQSCCNTPCDTLQKNESLEIVDEVLVKSDPSVDEEVDKENTRKCIVANTDQDLKYKFEVQSIKDNASDTEAEVTDFGNNDLNSSYSEKSEDDDDESDDGSTKKKVRKKEPQKCKYCEEVFKKRLDWLKHVRTKHTFEKPYSCDQCDSSYKNRYSLLIHSRKHKNEKPFICATCGKSFVSSADLNHHNKIHNKDRAYPCPICERSFKTHSNLRTHRLQMHLDPAEWKFPCNLCDKKFPIRGNLVKHLKRHAGIKEFDCHICQKKFVNKAELMLHLNTHTNQRLFKCTICDKDYKNREGLRRHMKVVHDQGNWKAPKAEKKYLCPMCPKIFAFGNKLQRHIFTHTGEKPFECDYCPKKFIDNYSRKVHLKKDHQMEFFS